MIPILPVTRACLLISVCLLEAGCKPSLHDLTVWQTDLRSPDGTWIANAYTIQNGGFGSADIYTAVQLQRGSQTPAEVVRIDSQGPMPHPYTLDNVANNGGSINLALKWNSPNNLQVTYSVQPGLKVENWKSEYEGIHIKLHANSETRN